MRTIQVWIKTYYSMTMSSLGFYNITDVSQLDANLIAKKVKFSIESKPVQGNINQTERVYIFKNKSDFNRLLKGI